MRVLTFHAEPMREAYRGLLQFALTHSATFSLVTRHDMKTRQSHDQCLNQLRPLLLDEQDVREWPGTRIDGTATLRRYKADLLALEPLCGAVKGLYRWVQPDHPEDLAFYDSQGRCWLETTAHEHLAFVDDTLVDVKGLVKAAPGIDLRAYQTQSA
jgi:hypothetical protein